MYFVKKSKENQRKIAQKTDTFIPILYIFIYQMGLRPMGISHGLNKCPLDTFLNGLSIPVGKQKENHPNRVVKVY